MYSHSIDLHVRLLTKYDHIDKLHDPVFSFKYGPETTAGLQVYTKTAGTGILSISVQVKFTASEYEPAPEYGRQLLTDLINSTLDRIGPEHGVDYRI